MTATVCACDGEAQLARASAAAQVKTRTESRWERVVVMIIFAISIDSNWTSDAPEIHPPAACRRRFYGIPEAPLAVLARVPNPICSMKAGLSTGGVVPAA